MTINQTGRDSGNQGPALSPFIYELYHSPQSGAEIEAKSFEIIDREAPAHHFSPDEWQVVRRMIHTTADLSISEHVQFSPDAIKAAMHALRNVCPIYVDSKMIRSGLSLARLRTVADDYDSNKIFCHISDPDVMQEANQAGLPRSLFAVRKAKHILDGGITIFGNAPVALLELNRMIMEDEIRPALVVAMPVGFVHVIESKRELMSLGVPYIAVAGRRGGSPLAVSVIHALCSLASQSNQAYE